MTDAEEAKQELEGFLVMYQAVVVIVILRGRGMRNSHSSLLARWQCYSGTNYADEQQGKDRTG
jgi:hypothetical protein